MIFPLGLRIIKNLFWTHSDYIKLDGIFILTFGTILIQDMQSGVITSLYLLCCILRMVKIKDLANTIAAALFYPVEAFAKFGAEVNGHIADHGFKSESQESNNDSHVQFDGESSTVNASHLSNSSGFHHKNIVTQNDCSKSNLALR